MGGGQSQSVKAALKKAEELGGQDLRVCHSHTHLWKGGRHSPRSESGHLRFYHCEVGVLCSGSSTQQWGSEGRDEECFCCVIKMLFFTAMCVLVRVHVHACAQDACEGQRAVLAVTHQSSSVFLLSPSGWSSANLQLVSVRIG